MPFPLHPLDEGLWNLKTPDPCILVIFGVTGDLAARKLIPALYNLSREGQLPPQFACVGFARRDKDLGTFRDELRRACQKYSRVPLADDLWQNFSEHLFYHRSSFDSDEGYTSLKNYLRDLDARFGTSGNRMYYLSTPPQNFSLIISKLHAHGLIYPPSDTHRWSRIIIEKPFGHNLASAIDLQKQISTYLDEGQIYRIDHYLGKETVQNLLVFRFCNPIFEALWNNRYIDHVQISVCEELGIGTRGHFFEQSGILRDIVQNHMMQLLSIVGMEPPSTLNAEAIRNEKVKVLQALRPFTPEALEKEAVRGQYGPGYIESNDVPGYREEKDVDPKSSVETFVALELAIDNWRWAGVPFYLRAGKRLPKRTTEIAIAFKYPPISLFPGSSKGHIPNILTVRIQPDEGIALKINCKIPGLNGPIQPVLMDFRYQSYFGTKTPEAYERLLCDCMIGDNTLFARDDEVLASWRLFDPLLTYWQQTPPPPFPNYSAGTWGPGSADILLQRSGRSWRRL